MTDQLDLTVGHILPYLDKHESLLIIQNNVELYDSESMCFRAEYDLHEDIDRNLLHLKINLISSNDDSILLFVKED